MRRVFVEAEVSPRLLPPHPFNHLMYCLNHDIRSIIMPSL
jgi:hypothetical protein